jgi:hypothetical protein
MKISDFEKALDQYGTNLGAWPAEFEKEGRTLLSASPAAGRSYDTLVRIEALIAGSAPQIDAARAARVANRAVAEIRRLPRNTPIDLFESLRRLFILPMPRVALAMSLSLIGFVIGMAVGVGEPHRTEAADLPMMTASAEDVLF